MEIKPRIPFCDKSGWWKKLVLGFSVKFNPSRSSVLSHIVANTSSRDGSWEDFLYG